jgi:hypothetical protein
MLAAAVVVGYWVAQGQRTILMMFAGLAVVGFVTTVMQRRAWVLIPLGWALIGRIPLLPLPLSVRDITVMLPVCAYIGYRVVAKADVRQKPHVLHLLILLNLGWFLVTYIIHPAGFSAFKSGTIGGRVYIEAGVAAMAYWLIIHMPDSVKTVSRIPFLMLASAVIVSVVTMMGYIFPGKVPLLFMFYTGFDLETYFAGMDVVRFKGISVFGMGIVPVLCAYYPPRTLFNPLRFRFYLLLLGVVSILVAGFRNRFLMVVAAIVIAALCHRGWRELLVAMILGALVVAGLVFGQGRFYDLPLGVQRTLTILPGNWSPIIAAEAEESSRWRFELWKTIISEKAIHNWWVGDGVTVSVEEVSAMRMNRAGSSTESAITTGYYHSGPLTAIRFAGIIGLVLFYCLMIPAAVYAARCVQQCRGTLLFPASVFLATQIIWFPVHFTFIFGSFDGDIAEMTFQTALLLLIFRMAPEARMAASNSLPTRTASAQTPALAKAAG